MKYSFLLGLFIITLYGCNNIERSVGFTTWSDDGTELKFFLGTEATISTVKKFDQFLQEKNYEGLNQIFSDTARFIYYNGVENSLKQFIKRHHSDSFYSSKPLPKLIAVSKQQPDIKIKKARSRSSGLLHCFF